MTMRVLPAALAAAALFGLIQPAAAATAPSPQVAGPKASAVKRVAESATGAEDEAGACTRARRKLWVEGEGWVVRRVTTCR